MKKQICFILALTLLAALVAVPAFALPNSTEGYNPEPNEFVTLTGFYNIGETAGVTVQAATAGGIVAGQQMSVDVDDSSATGVNGYESITMYPDSDRLLVTFDGANADKQYIIMLSRGTEKSTSAALFYINQQTGSAINDFTVKSSLLTQDEAVLTLWLIGEDPGDEKSVTLSYAAGTAHYKEPSAGYTVTINNMTSTYPATVEGVISGNQYDGALVFTIQCEKPCVAILATTNAGVVSYSKLVATSTGVANTYSFNTTVTEDIQLIVAIKGDADGDGIITSNDSSLIDRSIQLGKKHKDFTSELARTLADVDADGTITSNDSSLIDRSIQLGKKHKDIVW